MKKFFNVVLFIDEIYIIIGVGLVLGGMMDVFNLIKLVLVLGELCCIGLIIFQEYCGIFEKDCVLVCCFQKIDIVEFIVGEIYEILQGFKFKYEVYYGVIYVDDVLQVVVDLLVKYIGDWLLLDKVIDVIDEVGVCQCLMFEGQCKELIDIEEIEMIIVKMVCILVKQVSVIDKDVLQYLECNLKMVIFGQDLVIELLVLVIKLVCLGLGNLEKLIGNFLFVGLIGVGKIEVIKQLVLQLGIELVCFDMSEYMELYLISCLIGVFLGYVGFDQGGLFIEKIVKIFYCVLLLDEVEKVYLDIFNILLQVMDCGVFIDINGCEVNFKNVVLVMIINVGVVQVVWCLIGFICQDYVIDVMEVICKSFMLEFCNCLDVVVQFQLLGFEYILCVVDKFLIELEMLLQEKYVSLLVMLIVCDWLVYYGFDLLMGVCLMVCVIQDKIKCLFVDELLFGKLINGGKVSIDVCDDELFIEIQVELEWCLLVMVE